MDKTISADWKPDYATVLSGTSQAPKVEIGTETVLTVHKDEVRAPDILYQHVGQSQKTNQSATLPTSSMKQTAKPQSSDAAMFPMCPTQYIKSTNKLKICDCMCCIKCLKMSSNE